MLVLFLKQEYFEIFVYENGKYLCITSNLNVSHVACLWTLLI
jgi:hypothetical protein